MADSKYAHNICKDEYHTGNNQKEDVSVYVWF